MPEKIAGLLAGTKQDIAPSAAKGTRAAAGIGSKTLLSASMCNISLQIFITNASQLS